MFVSRAGLKLDHALTAFSIDVGGLVCADFGCNAGGFTDCLLQRGASRVYAIDTGYGMLEWKLRQHPQVVTMERTNAMHVTLPEPVRLVVIDVAWTRQHHILPAARKVLAEGGEVVTLIKPHYEAEKPLLRKGVLPSEELPRVQEIVRDRVQASGFEIVAETTSPIVGGKGNVELLWQLRPRVG